MSKCSRCGGRRASDGDCPCDDLDDEQSQELLDAKADRDIDNYENSRDQLDESRCWGGRDYP